MKTMAPTNTFAVLFAILLKFQPANNAW